MGGSTRRQRLGQLDVFLQHSLSPPRRLGVPKLAKCSELAAMPR